MMNLKLVKLGSVFEFSTVEKENAQTLNIQGYELLLAGKAEEALRCFRKSLELTPGKAVILNNLGNALFNLNRLDEAKEAYQQAISSQRANKVQ